MNTRRVLFAVPVVVVLISAVLTVYIVSQPIDDSPSVDAVFMHAGGTGERLTTSVELWQSVPGEPVLIIPNGNAWEEGRRWCEMNDPNIRCDSPTIDTTLGEAHLLAKLAHEFEWDTVAIVTSDYHLRRSLILDDRCSELELHAVSAGHQVNPIQLIGKYIHEFGGLVFTLTQGCES